MMTPLEQYPNAPDLFHAYRYWLSFPSVTRAPGGWEFEGRFYPDYLFVGGASFAIHRTAAQHCVGQGIDIGAGLWPLPGGKLFLYLPHPTCAIWRPGAPFVGDGHKWAPSPEIIKAALNRLGGRVLACDDGPDAMQSFFVCAGFSQPPRSW